MGYRDFVKVKFETKLILKELLIWLKVNDESVILNTNFSRQYKNLTFKNARSSCFYMF